MAQFPCPFNCLPSVACPIAKPYIDVDIDDARRGATGESLVKAMVLAAGLGTRMGALTAVLPKPLLEVGGETLVERQIRLLAAAGVTDIVVNTSRRGELIRAALGDGRRWNVTLSYSDEGPEPLETGGGILNALGRFDAQPFLVVNADVLTDFPFATLALAGTEGVLVLVPNPDHHPSGDFALDAEGFVRADGPKLTYAGVALFAPRLFAGHTPGRQPLKPALDAAIARGKLRGVRYDGLWVDVGTPQRLVLARELVGNS